MSFNNLSWSIITFVSLFVSLSVFVFFAVFNNFSMIYTEPGFYLCMLIGIVLSLLPKYLVRFFQVWFVPTDIDIVREIQKYEWVEGKVINFDVVEHDQESKSFISLPDIQITHPTIARLPERISSNFGEKSPIHNLFTSTGSMEDKEINLARKRSFRSSGEAYRVRSIKVMGTCEEEENTGFAYSQEPGMELIITPNIIKS